MNSCVFFVIFVVKAFALRQTSAFYPAASAFAGTGISFSPDA